MKGLSQVELAAVVGALQREVAGCRVRDVAALRDHDDLLFYLDRSDGSRRTLHLAPGGVRARITTTGRRFGRDEFATGPQSDAMKTRFDGAVLTTCEALPGERIAKLHFTLTDTTAVELWVELFGPRGLWCVADRAGVILELSRQPKTKNRSLAIGGQYTPPDPAPGPARTSAAPPPPEDSERDPAELLAAVDQRYTEHDLAVARARQRGQLERALHKAILKTRAKIDGLVRQQATAKTAPELRQTADLLLAYGHAATRGATVLKVPDPNDPERECELTLDPKRRPHEQANALYDRARRLTEGVAKAAEREQGFRAELARLEALQAELGTIGAADQSGDHGAWSALVTRAVEAKLVPATRGAASEPGTRKPKRAGRALVDDKGRAFRQFASGEGYVILVGRDNHQNDRLSLRVAKGNDLWLHVGAGRAGSHVIVRLPKHKTASLETMLDAGTLAIHFSKARGADRMDVTYTFAKHVRKPKGLPPGKVIPHHVKTLTVRLEPDRLKRLLASAPPDSV